MFTSQQTTRAINLVVFDADDTLWYGLDGGYISGLDYRDDGRDDYTFHRLDDLHIQRNDGKRFRLYSETPLVLAELVRRNALISLASYNRLAPTLSALQAFELERFFHHPVIQWSGRKDMMLQTILHNFTQDGYRVSPATSLFIDDDQSGHYRKQMASIGVNFLQRGVDILDLTEILDHPAYTIVPATRLQPSLRNHKS
jgi:magnesium-dependent phosphatase-1